jgi:hypothetical protein
MDRLFAGKESEMEVQYLQIFTDEMKENYGCGVLAGFLLLVIPIIGWIIGILLILSSSLVLIAPRHMLRWIAKEEWEKLREKAQFASRNTYANVSCPACGAYFTDNKSAFFFLSDPEGINCGVCNSRIIRRGGRLSLS